LHSTSEFHWITQGTNALSQEGHTSMPDYEIYYKSLISKGRGSPLWIPGPSMLLPTDYRRNGISIGDVGIIYQLGVFDFLFNVFLPSDHCINEGRVPKTFNPLDLSTMKNDISKSTVYGPDTYLPSSSLRKKSCTDSSYVFLL
jgi:hypothetical protein